MPASSVLAKADCTTAAALAPERRDVVPLAALQAARLNQCPLSHTLGICVIDLNGSCDVCDRTLDTDKYVMECRECNWWIKHKGTVRKG